MLRKRFARGPLTCHFGGRKLGEDIDERKEHHVHNLTRQGITDQRGGFSTVQHISGRPTRDQCLVYL